MSTLSIRSGFIDHLGVELLRAEDGESELRLKLAPQHLNSWEVMHGGVTMALLDVALSTASRSTAPEGTGPRAPVWSPSR